MIALQKHLPRDLSNIVYEYSDRERKYVNHQMDKVRYRHERQLRFIWGREDGEFLKRLMVYANNLFERTDIKEMSHILNSPSLRIEGTVGDKVRIYNDEYHSNLCRCCGWYVFSNGCEYCGIRYRTHVLNIVSEL